MLTFLVEAMLSPREKVRKDILSAPVRALNTVPESAVLPIAPVIVATEKQQSGTWKFVVFFSLFILILGDVADTPTDFYLADLYRQLTSFVNSRPSSTDRPCIFEGRLEWVILIYVHFI